jgi:tetratricopeptide (TPR) repeat protein
MAACAARTAPPLPSVLAHPNFVYPVVPAAVFPADAAQRVDRAWRFLQNGDEISADSEFQAALRNMPTLYPAQAGSAYVALARQELDAALSGFDVVLQTSPGYIPALVGRGQTLLLLDRQLAALETFEAALAADGTLDDIRRTVDVLRFRTMQEVIASARGAAADGRIADARAGYARAIATSPDSAFLHRELGLLDRGVGDGALALQRFRRAVELDAADAESLIQIGELLEEQQDTAGAIAAYRRAADIAPSADLNARLAAMAEISTDSSLPPQFLAIADATAITRGDLAALIGVRLADVLETADTRDVVMTDMQAHWASPWVLEVARAGILDPFANHEFQPDDRITRADLARAVSRLIALLATERPALRGPLTARPQIADMAAGHLSYPDVSVAVASGVTPLVEGGRFEAVRAVPGTEAIEAVARLRTLAGQSR